jgi:hypothetical protein
MYMQTVHRRLFDKGNLTRPLESARESFIIIMGHFQTGPPVSTFNIESFICLGAIKNSLHPVQRKSISNGKSEDNDHGTIRLTL